METETPTEYANRMKVSRHTVYRWIREGRLKIVRIGRTVRIQSEE